MLSVLHEVGISLGEADTATSAKPLCQKQPRLSLQRGGPQGAPRLQLAACEQDMPNNGELLHISWTYPARGCSSSDCCCGRQLSVLQPCCQYGKGKQKWSILFHQWMSIYVFNLLVHITWAISKQLVGYLFNDMTFCLQVKQAFSTSSTSCLMGMQMKFDTEERKHDPCWQIIQQLQLRIEKVIFSPELFLFHQEECFSLYWQFKLIECVYLIFRLCHICLRAKSTLLQEVVHF